MSGPTSVPAGERPGRPGTRWETRLTRVEQYVADDAPTPTPNRATRRALARQAPEEPMTDPITPARWAAALHTHYTDFRVRLLAEARWRMKTDGTRTEWLVLGKDNPAALIKEGRDWIRAAVAAGILPAYGQPVPHRFYLLRHHDVSGVSGEGVVADGVLWPDGTASVRWRGEHPSTVHWDRGQVSVDHIHGHQGATEIVWVDEPEDLR
ncbi:hypothetical protein [Streptomyces sp. NPDC058612]|uniref:hypothetical protein n=1 Tax=Streptomyces sp. NPDC058612 TaxID=3346555 RepID=UPI003653C1B4